MADERKDTPTTCPNCSREVEAGFKFCDFCGTKLEAGPTTAPKEQGSFLERRRAKWRENRESTTGELQQRMVPSDPLPIPLVPPPPPPASPRPPTAPPPPPVPARPTSQITKAEDLKAATEQSRVGMSGRLQWQEDEKPKDRPPTWRPITDDPVPALSESTGRMVATFVIQLVISALIGAVFVGIAAVVASLTSNGRVALLEIRGLPVFIAGATAIIVFALLRTSPKRSAAGRRSVAISVLIGFLVLVGATAVAYSPSVMSSAQRRLDRALGYFGSDVVDAVHNYEGDVEQWNAEVHRYSLVHLTTLTKARNTEVDPKKLAIAEETFRFQASGAEEALDGIVKRMRSHTDAISNVPLRDSLEDLTAIFSDELSGIHLITRGFVNDDQALINSGNTRFKDATQRAVEFYDQRVKKILERGQIDTTPLSNSIADLRG